MCDIHGESYFSKKKMFTNGLNIGLSQRVWVEKTVHGVKTYIVSCKEIVPVQRSLKKVTVFWDTKGSNTFDFLEKSAFENSKISVANFSSFIELTSYFD